MTTISHSSTATFCDKGDTCEFFKNEKKIPSASTRFKNYIDNRCIWSGIGAVTNYLSGGSAIAGALFDPLDSAVNKGLNFLVSKLPIKQDLLSVAIATHIANQAISMFTVTSALNAIGYPVTNFTLNINLIPRVAEVALLFLMAVNTDFEAQEEKQAQNHMLYHKVPGPN